MSGAQLTAALIFLSALKAAAAWKASTVNLKSTSEGCTPELMSALKAQAEADLRAAYSEPVKQTRTVRVADVKSAAVEALANEDEGVAAGAVGDLFKSLEKDVVRGQILDTGQRIDGRDTKTVRPIVSEVSILPRSHGSALFTRGETQAMVVTTLGTGEDEQFIDALSGTYKERFLLHL